MGDLNPQQVGQQVARALKAYRTGIVLGGLIGLVSGAIPGLLLGAVVGGLVNRALVGFMQGPHSPQAIFFKATFSVMGCIAKADGRVTEAEIQYAQAVMARMNLSAQRRQEAIAYFTEGKAEEFELAGVLEPLARLIQRRPEVKIMFVEIQLQAAMADGHISEAEQQIVRQVCALLQLSGAEMATLVARMQAQQFFYQQGGSGGAYTGQAVDPALQLKEAYGVLGVSAQASDAEVKRAYRKLMSQHHPDKLVAKGLPAEMMQLAKEKTQEIQAAYDRVKAARRG